MAVWEISWQLGDTVMADRFNVYTREAVGDRPWVAEGVTTGRSFRIDVAEGKTALEAAVAPVVNGIEADESVWAVVQFRPDSLEGIALPPDVGELSVEQIDQSFDVRCRFTPVTDPFLDGYEIREGSTWETGLRRAFVPKGAKSRNLEATFGAMASGVSTTYYVKAVSVHGRYSANAASATVTVQRMGGWTQMAEHSESPTFSGTKTDMEVDSSKLRVTEETGVIDDYTSGVIDDYDSWAFLFPHHGSGTYVTATQEAQGDSGGVVADEVIEVEIAGALSNPTTVTIDDLDALMDPDFTGDDSDEAVDLGRIAAYDRVNIDDELLDGLDLKIEIDTTPDDPSGSPTWDGWRTWVPGARYRYRGVRLRFTLTLYWFTNFEISTLKWRRFRRNLKEEGEADVDDTAGISVSFEEPFTKAPCITFGSSTAGKEGYYQIGSVTTTGFTIKVYDTTDGSDTTGVVSWLAAGV